MTTREVVQTYMDKMNSGDFLGAFQMCAAGDGAGDDDLVFHRRIRPERRQTTSGRSSLRSTG